MQITSNDENISLTNKPKKLLADEKGSLPLIVAIIIFGILGISYFLIKDKLTVSNTYLQSPLSPTLLTLSPTPFPFQELTIPYLRGRTYTSTLSDLEKAYENESYVAYLTSFNSDGLRINGLLTIPKGDSLAKYPAIVFIHGYIPPKQYETQGQYHDYVDYLTRNGFVVFKIDLRGHGQSEGESSGGYYSGDYVVDTLNAIAALESADFVDRKNIGLWGHSMSGNIAMRSFAAKPTIPAVVIWAGAGYTYTDLSDYSIEDGSYRPLPPDSESVRKRQLLRETYGNFSQDSPFWKQVAPTNYLADLKGAIQLNHAVDDPVVSIEYSRNLTKLLDETPIPHELNEYPSGGHNISGVSFTQAMQKTVEFFRRHLAE